MREEINNSAGFKTQISDLQNQLIDFKKKIQLKENEIKEQIWKEQALEKKILKYQKDVSLEIFYFSNTSFFFFSSFFFFYPASIETNI